MPNDQSTQTLLNTGTAVAAAIIVVRIILEQFGAPETVNNLFGVAWLHLIMAVLFALRLAKAGEASPYKALFLNIVLFGIYTRLMVMLTYMAAYRFSWPAPRFSGKMGGNVGPAISPLQGYLVIPLRNALIWIVMATITGMIIGVITLWLRRRSTAKTA